MKIRIKHKKYKLLDCIIILLLSMSYYYMGGNRGFNLHFGYFFPFVISVFITIMAIIKIKKNYYKYKVNNNVKLGFYNNFIPEIILISIGFITYIINDYSIQYYKHWISMSMLYILPIIESISLIIIYDRNAIDIIFKASVLSYSWIIIFFIYKYGIINLIISGYNQVFNNSNVNTFLEAHEITFVFGIFLIIYLQNYKNNKFKIFLCIFFIVLGYKRILAVALIIAILFSFISKNINNKIIYKKIISIISIGIIICSYMWIYLLRDGYLKNKYYNEQTYLDTSGISSRLKISFQISDQYDFSIMYFGKGFGYIDKYRDIKFNKPIALHNDLLKKYVEYGFIMYGIYLFYRVYIITNKIYKKSGKQSATIYMSLMIINIICWLTDNISGYFMYLVSFYTITISLYQGKNNTFERSKNVK